LWQGVCLVVAGLLLIDPHWTTDLIGAALAVVVGVWQLATKRAGRAQAGSRGGIVNGNDHP